MIIAATGALGVQNIITWLLNRGRIKIDDATTMRKELRDDLEQKKKDIAKLERRILTIEDAYEAREQEFIKKEREFDQALLRFRMYKVDSYRVLLEGGVSKAVLDQIRLLDF
jgi:polyhydroxyalkanoate synthesis regulator phasin